MIPASSPGLVAAWSLPVPLVFPRFGHVFRWICRISNVFPAFNYLGMLLLFSRVCHVFRWICRSFKGFSSISPGLFGYLPTSSASLRQLHRAIFQDNLSHWWYLHRVTYVGNALSGWHKFANTTDHLLCCRSDTSCLSVFPDFFPQRPQMIHFSKIT